MIKAHQADHSRAKLDHDLIVFITIYEQHSPVHEVGNWIFRVGSFSTVSPIITFRVETIIPCRLFCQTLLVLRYQFQLLPHPLLFLCFHKYPESMAKDLRLDT